MAIKTLTITEDAHKLLLDNKLRGESLSEEIARVLTARRKKLSDFFGILSKEEGAEMLKNLEKVRKMNIKLMGRRLKRLRLNS